MKLFNGVIWPLLITGGSWPQALNRQPAVCTGQSVCVSCRGCVRKGPGRRGPAARGRSRPSRVGPPPPPACPVPLGL